MSTQDALRKSSISSLTALIGLQLFSRLFTFTLNQVLIRMASPEVFGAAAIQFELILSTILFLSREGVRTTILRVKTPGPASMNLSFVPMMVGIPLGLVPYMSSKGVIFLSECVLELWANSRVGMFSAHDDGLLVQ